MAIHLSRRSGAMNALSSSLKTFQIIHHVRNNTVRTTKYYDIAKLELISN